MAKNCTYTVPGMPKPLSENEFKSYLLKEGLDSFAKEGLNIKGYDSLIPNAQPITSSNETSTTKGSTETTESKGINKEAQDLLASIKEGSKPTFITKNLERIAKENGIEVTDKMTADDVINALKEKQTLANEKNDTKGATQSNEQKSSKEEARTNKETSKAQPTAEEKSIAATGKELADRIRSLKSKPRQDVLQANIFGVGVSLYNTSIDIVATAVENGAKLADAIARGVEYIKTNYGESLDEDDYVKNIEDRVRADLKTKEDLTNYLNYIDEYYVNKYGIPSTSINSKIIDFTGAIDKSDLSEQELREAVKKSKLYSKAKNKIYETIADRGKRVAEKIRSLKSPRDIAQANIFGIPVAIYDGLLETIATAVENGAKLVDAIQEAIKSIPAKNRENFDEEGFIRHLDDIETGEKPTVKVQVGGEDIDNYSMTTGSEVNKFLSGKTIEDVFGEESEGEQQYNVQKLTDMLQDGLNMIGIAQGQWGNDVMDYGRPLFEHIQAMSNDAVLTNKKAVLLATFLGELKESMLREPSRRAEIQPLYNAVEGYYQRYMNIRGKEVVAGRLLRLYRDKYIGDLFANRILEERLVKDKEAILKAEQTKKIDDEIAAKEKKVTAKQKDTQDKADKATSKKAKENQAKKGKLSTDDAKQKAADKAEEIKNKAGGQQGLIDKINEAIERLNCK